MELKDKTIIITGASSGIGEAAAGLFAAEGARLVLGSRRRDNLEIIADRISAEGGHAVCLAGDVREEGYAQALVDLAVREFGTLDGAFNNAGMVGPMAPVGEMELADWNDVVATNLTSAFLAARAQVPVLAGRGGGSIVFTSSFVGFSNGGLPGMAAYAASKAGLIGLTQSLGADHAGANVRVNAASRRDDHSDGRRRESRCSCLRRRAAPHEAHGGSSGDRPGRAVSAGRPFLLHDRKSHARGRRSVGASDLNEYARAAGPRAGLPTSVAHP